jgi:hypothetical protein
MMTDRDERHQQQAEREEKLKRAKEMARAHAAKVDGSVSEQQGNEHDRSRAAHLDEDERSARTKPEGNLRQGSNPGARRQP